MNICMQRTPDLDTPCAHGFRGCAVDHLLDLPGIGSLCEVRMAAVECRDDDEWVIVTAGRWTAAEPGGTSAAMVAVATPGAMPAEMLVAAARRLAAAVLAACDLAERHAPDAA